MSAHTHHRTRLALVGVLLLTTTLASACSEPESDPTGPTLPSESAINEIVTTAPINASSSDTLVYFSLATNAVVARTDAWDIALRRYEVRLNSGVSGGGSVTGYSLGNNSAATSAEILAFTPDNTLAAFDAVRDAQIPADTAFRADRLVANNTGYLNLAGVPSANATAYWKVRTATGAFALVRVTAISLSQSFALTNVAFEVRQQSGTTVGAAQAFSVAVGSTPVAVNLATAAAVAANGCNWDLQITPQSFGISVNTVCNAGTFPGPASPTFAAATTASDAPEYAAYLAVLTGPIPNSITESAAPFRYNLAGNNRLDPSFNTYLIRSGTRVYKLQLIGYYSAAGASGFPTLRVARIR